MTMTNDQMLKRYLVIKKARLESGEDQSDSRVHGPEYDEGLLNAYTWVLKLLNEEKVRCTMCGHVQDYDPMCDQCGNCFVAGFLSNTLKTMLERVEEKGCPECKTGKLIYTPADETSGLWGCNQCTYQQEAK